MAGAEHGPEISISCGLTDTMAGTIAPVGFDQPMGMVLREPIGVVAAIVPWNSQLHLSAFKVAPALAAGCTVY